MLDDRREPRERVRGLARTPPSRETLSTGGQRSLVVLASVVLAIALARAGSLASAPLQQALVPILVGAVGILLGSVLVALDKFQIEFPPAQWAVFMIYVAIPARRPRRNPRSRLARSTVGDLLRRAPRRSIPDRVRDALA